MFLKQILGVQKQTNNVGVLLEIGKVPIQLSAIKLATKNWERIRKANANKFVCQSYQDAECKLAHVNWASSVRNVLSKYGMLNLFIGQNHTKSSNVCTKLYNRLVDNFFQEAWAQIRNENCKLRTYNKIKMSRGKEGYLEKIKIIKHRIAFSRFRLSNHKLNIEVGRHKKIVKEQSILCE